MYKCVKNRLLACVRSNTMDQFVDMISHTAAVEEAADPIYVAVDPPAPGHAAEYNAALAGWPPALPAAVQAGQAAQWLPAVPVGSQLCGLSAQHGVTHTYSAPAMHHAFTF
jgi:hypothetical protein